MKKVFGTILFITLLAEEIVVFMITLPVWIWYFFAKRESFLGYHFNKVATYRALYHAYVIRYLLNLINGKSLFYYSVKTANERHILSELYELRSIGCNV